MIFFFHSRKIFIFFVLNVKDELCDWYNPPENTGTEEQCQKHCINDKRNELLIIIFTKISQKRKLLNCLNKISD